MSYIDNINDNEKAFLDTGFCDNLKKSIDYYMDIIDVFHDAFSMHEPCVSLLIQQKSIFIGHVLISAKNTLYSCYNCCCTGCFSDAYMLLRKYRDDLFFHLYFLACIDDIEKTTGEYCNSENPFNNFINGDGSMDAEKVADGICGYLKIHTNSYDKALDDDQKMNLLACLAWINNTVSELNECEKKKLNCCNYLEFLKQNPQIKKIFRKGLNKNWYSMTNTLNDYTHNNGYKIPIANQVRLSATPDFKEKLDKFVDDVEWITSAFASVYLLIKPSISNSSDYIDYLDVGEKPPLDSQYWVAPVFQEFLEKHIKKCFPWVADYIKNENNYSMIYD